MKPAVIWVILALLRFYFLHDINAAIWFLRIFLDGAMVLAGLWIAISLIVRGLRAKPKRRSYIEASATVILLGSLLWLSPFGHMLGTRAKLHRHENKYKTLVSRMQTMEAEPARKQFGDDVEIIPGEPRRMAFSWGGLLDNWHGIVFDPTGDVLKFKDNNRDDIRLWFGGVMTSAEHIWGDWYYCTFT